MNDAQIIATNDGRLIAEAYSLYCTLPDVSRKAFLVMCQRSDPGIFANCVPIFEELQYERKTPI